MFNWTQMIPGVTHETVHVATLTLATVASVAIGATARAQLGSGQQAVIPAGKFSIRGIFEILTEFIYKLANQVIGHEGKHYVPYFTAIFFFILFFSSFFWCEIFRFFFKKKRNWLHFFSSFSSLV